MKKLSLHAMFVLLSAVLICGCTSYSAQSQHTQPELAFEVSIEQPATHYIDVTLTCKGLSDTCTNFCMPAWAPGYYKILNSARHVVDFAATTSDGKPLSWEKSEKSRWSVHNGETKDIRITYRVFANCTSVAEANVNQERAFLANNEVFLYLENQLNIPCTVTLKPYKEWTQIATGLPCIDAATHTYYAENFDVLFDSPFFIGNQTMYYFSHEGHDYTISLAYPDRFDSTLLVNDLKSVISQATALMGDVPYKDYCFIFMEPGGGGLEHSNSQACFVSYGRYYPESLGRFSTLSFFAHEYYHLYNVKRIRPIELGPFDYSKENYASLLWFSEGATCYYEYILLSRAGLSSEAFFNYTFTSNLQAIENSTGRLHMSLSRSGFDIWNNFFYNDRNGTTISYYDKGPLICMLMDIALRKATDNRGSLDDVMRLLYNRYHKELNRGFTEAEFWTVVDEVAEHTDLSEIKSYVYTTCEVDYQKYLNWAGIALDTTALEQQSNPQVTARKWEVSFMENPDSAQLAIRNAMFFNSSSHQ